MASLHSLARKIAAHERREKSLAEAATYFDPNCICFPTKAPPWVPFPVLGLISFLVKCPLHGDRFFWDELWPQRYVPGWVRKLQYKHFVESSRSLGMFEKCAPLAEVYRKALLAGMPPDLFYGVEDEEGDHRHSRVFLTLKDGTRFQANELHFEPRVGDPPHDLESVLRQDRIWVWKSVSIVSNLLRARGRIVRDLPELVDGRLSGEEEKP